MVLLPLVVLTACESDERRLERLQTEGIEARRSVHLWQLMDAAGEGHGDSLRAAERRLLMHQREMNRFMEGR